MVDRGLNIHLDVCGPTEHMPSYFEQCLTRIVEQGLESVITIRGTVKVRELLPEFDLFVLPSYNEGLPVVSLETMGAGIPTVSTDVGAVRSVVEDMIDSVRLMVDRGLNIHLDVVRAHRAHALLLRAVPDPHRRAGPGERHHRARHRQGPRAPARVRPVRPAQLQRGPAGSSPWRPWGPASPR